MRVKLTPSLKLISRSICLIGLAPGKVAAKQEKTLPDDEKESGYNL